MFTIKSPVEGENLQFTIDGSSFLKELKLVTSIFRSGSEILVAATDGQLAIVATDNSKNLCLLVDATEVSGEGCFNLATDIFSGILNNRAEITFTLSSANLNFKALKGRYSGDMLVEPINSGTIDSLNEVFNLEVKDLSIPDSVFSTLEKGIKHCALRDAYGESDNELVRYITGKDNAVKIVTYDQFHSAILETTLDKKLKKNFAIAVYQSYFSAINSLSRGEKFNIAITNKFFYVKNQSFFLSLPPIQYSEEDFNSALEMMEAVADENKSCSCKISTNSFSKVVDNLCSIYELGSKIEIQVAKDKMKLNLATNYGSMSDSFTVGELEGKGTINVDAPPLNDVIGCAPAMDATFSFIENKAYLLNFELENTKICYIVAVLQ